MVCHEDITAYGTVIVAFTADESLTTALQLGKDGSLGPCPFLPGGMIALKDLLHELPEVVRQQQRVSDTVNLFFG